MTDLNFGNKQISLLATTVTTATSTTTLKTALKEQHLGRNTRVFYFGVRLLLEKGSVKFSIL